MLVVLLLVTALTLIFFSIYYTLKKRLQYWKKKNVPYLKPVPILGNFSEYILFKKYLGHVTQNLCQKFPNAPYFGAFFGTEPTLIVQDPELIKLIMTKDFYFPTYSLMYTTCMRFAKMQVISGVITLLKKYRIELAQDMKREVVFEPKSFVTYPIGGIRLKFTEREGWKDRMLQSSNSKVSS